MSDKTTVRNHHCFNQAIWYSCKMCDRNGEALKLQPKFVGPHEVVEAYRNHTYLLEHLGQATVQNECRLKLYRPCIEKAGQAPGMLENTSCKTSVNSKKKETGTGG